MYGRVFFVSFLSFHPRQGENDPKTPGITEKEREWERTIKKTGFVKN